MPPEYGLYDITPDAPVEYDTIVPLRPRNLALISDLTDAPLPELVQLNPALLRGTAPAVFDLHVPKGMVEDVRSGLRPYPRPPARPLGCIKWNPAKV